MSTFIPIAGTDYFKLHTGIVVYRQLPIVGTVEK